MLTCDIAFAYKNKQGESICGDTVKIKKDDKRIVVSVSDGLGSGVKASILSTLTASIATAMIFNNIPLEEVFKSILSTLPICKVRGISYANLCSVLFDVEENTCSLIEYEFPVVLLFRDGKESPIERKKRYIEGREISEGGFSVKEGDSLFIMTDGVSQAGMGTKLFPLGFGLENIKKELINLLTSKVSCKEIAEHIIRKVKKLDETTRGDDALVVSLYFREFRRVNILVGPPEDPSKDEYLVKRFINLPGKKVVCGGTTGQIVEKVLNRRVRIDLSTLSEMSPPVGYIDGVDLVTEGIVTLTQVFRYIEGQDTKIGYGARRLIEIIRESDGINFLVGRAINPAHQNPLFSHDISLKFRLISDIARLLEKEGKIVNIEYY